MVNQTGRSGDLREYGVIGFRLPRDHQHRIVALVVLEVIAHDAFEVGVDLELAHEVHAAVVVTPEATVLDIFQSPGAAEHVVEFGVV